MNLEPNGESSNLTQEQYRLVQTPTFKKWFGNWETEPQVYYHGSYDYGWKVVDVHGSSEQCLFWMSTSKTMAEGFTGARRFGYKNEQEYFEREGRIGGVYSFFVKTNKIFDVFNYNQVEEVNRELVNLIDKEYVHTYVGGLSGYNGKYNRFKSKDYYKNPKGEDWIGGWTSYDWNIVEGWESDMWIIGMLKQLGYDCITNKEGGVLNIGFIGNPEQIKLADGTNTTFDSNNPNISK